MAARKHVALIVETSSIYGRRILSGVNKFMRSHLSWTVFLEQSSLATKPPDWLQSWEGDGIISRSTDRKLTQLIADKNIPMVELTDRHGPKEMPHVWSDDLAIAKMAAEHLLERGFQNFAFCGFAREYWSQQRQEGFADAVARKRFECKFYETPWFGSGALPWEQELREMQQWLISLPKPVGIMACNDVRGKMVLDACHAVDLAVPEEVAVVGVDNDDLLCDLCVPPLSSIISNAELVGYKAAELLDLLMCGGTPAKSEVLVKPLGVATRQSTEVLAIDDHDISIALKMIRERACDGLTIDEIMQEVVISRSILERRFRKLLGRSPQAVIRQTQLKRVRQLLAETDLTLASISQLAGYKHTEHMAVVFKRETGETPGQFRSRSQLPNG